MSSGNLPATPSLKTIESAIELIDAKKGELKKAFDDIQAISPHPFSFSISWSDLDSHFTAVQNSVVQRFRLLESRESSRRPVPLSEHTRCSTLSSLSNQGDPLASKPLTTLGRVDSVTDSDVNRPLNQNVPLNCDQTSSSSSVGLRTDGSVPAVVPRPELKEFCERMDWKGLRKYINGQEERVAIQKELPGALKSAPDPGAMVLDAMEGFYAENDPNKGDKDIDWFELRRICVYLLERLMETGLSFSEEVRERAKKLALEWKGMVSLNKAKTIEPLAFLLLVAAYSLGAVVDKEELVEYFFAVAAARQAPRLCRSIGLGEKVHDLIQKLVDNGKQHHAVRFILEFGLAEKFPPVPLLDNYVKEKRRLAEQVCIDGNNSYSLLNDATKREILALKSVIKVIKISKLETEYPPECLQKRLEQLEKQLADRKSIAMLTAPGSQQHQAIELTSQQGKKKKKKKKKKDIESASQQAQGKQQHDIESANQQVRREHQHDIESTSQQVQGEKQQSGNKRPKTTETVFPTATSFGVAGSSSVVPPFQQSHLQPAGLLADQSAAYSSTLTGPSRLAVPTPAVNPYLSQQFCFQPAGLLPDQSAAYSSLLTSPYGSAGPTPTVNPYLSQQSHFQPAGLLSDQSAAYSSSQPSPYGLAGPTPIVNPYLSQQSHLQPAGLFPNQSAAYSSSLTGPYGFIGPSPAVNPYLGSSVIALLDLASTLSGFSVSSNPAASHFHPSGHQPFNGAYGLPPGPPQCSPQ